jgi:hypothetical protein
VRGSGYGPFNSILAFACQETRRSRPRTNTEIKSVTKEKPSIGIVCLRVKTWTCYLLLYLLTHCTELSPSWEANWLSASQEIPCILWNVKVHYHIYKCLPPVPILSIWTYHLPNVTVLSCTLRHLICAMLESFLSLNEFPLLQQHPNCNSMSIYC